MLAGAQKALVVLVLSALELLEYFTGWKSGIGEDWIMSVLAVLAPILVWFTPNR